MGGDRFPQTRRLRREELAETAAKVQEALASTQCAVRCRMPPELTDKTTFGDVDLIVAAGKDHAAPGSPKAREEELQHRQEAIEVAAAALQSTARKGDALTQMSLLSAEGFQVDLEFVPSECFAIAVAVHAHGDACWMLGRLLQAHGLKLTTHGLFIRRTAADLRRDLLLSTDPCAIAAFIGIDQSFFDGATPKSQEQVFAAVYGSRFFDRSAYMANFDASRPADRDQRRRVARRPMLAAFQAWLLAKPARDSVDACGCDKSDVDAPDLPSIAKLFGRETALVAAIQDAQNERETRRLRRACKAFVNGNFILQRYPHLPGPAVGQVLERLRATRGQNSWQVFLAWLQSATSADLERAIDELVVEIQPLEATAAGSSSVDAAS